MTKQHPTTHLQDLCGFPAHGFKAISENIELHLTYKARGAIYETLESLDKKKRTVLVPAFHCPTVVQPVLLAGYSVKFFKINRNLTIDLDDLMGLLNDKIAAVIIINYFGFESDIGNLKSECEKFNAVLIEDCSHSMMKNYPVELTGGRAHVAVFSFWKNIPSIGGAGIRVNDNALVLRSTRPKPLGVLNTIKLYKQVLEAVINNFNDRNLIRRLFNKIEHYRVKSKGSAKSKVDAHTGDNQSAEATDSYPMVPEYFYCGIPWVSRQIIRSANLDLIRKRVLENYKDMADQLCDIKKVRAIQQVLPERIFPWCFPVIMENRPLFENAIKQAGVNFFTFGEKLHDAVNNPELISTEALDIARFLSNSVICFSINQDIDTEDIYHTGNVLKTIFDD